MLAASSARTASPACLRWRTARARALSWRLCSSWAKASTATGSSSSVTDGSRLIALSSMESWARTIFFSDRNRAALDASMRCSVSSWPAASSSASVSWARVAASECPPESIRTQVRVWAARSSAVRSRAVSRARKPFTMLSRPPRSSRDRQPSTSISRLSSPSRESAASASGHPGSESQQYWKVDPASSTSKSRGTAACRNGSSLSFSLIVLPRSGMSLSQPRMKPSVVGGSQPALSDSRLISPYSHPPTVRRSASRRATSASHSGARSLSTPTTAWGFPCPAHHRSRLVIHWTAAAALVQHPVPASSRPWRTSKCPSSRQSSGVSLRHCLSTGSAFRRSASVRGPTSLGTSSTRPSRTASSSTRMPAAVPSGIR